MPGSAKVGWAVMGTETIATEQMVAAIRTVGHLPLWVVSRDPHYARSFADDMDIPNATSDMQLVWDDPEVRFVYVSATRRRRPHHIAAAAEAGKHILCDGPLCDDKQEAARLVGLCHDTKVTLAVHHLGRASSVHQTMKRLIREGEIGQVHTISIARGGPFHPRPNRRAQHSSGEGDILYDAAIEDVDLVRFLTDAEPQYATGMWKLSENSPQQIAFLIHMDDGSLFQGHESFLTTEMEDTVVVAGTKGALIANGSLNGRGSGTLTRRLAGKNELIPIRERDIHLAAVQDFVTGLHGRPTWLSTGEDSVANLHTIDALSAAVKGKQVVDIKAAHTRGAAGGST